MPAIEIVEFPATEAYLADNKILDKGLGAIIKSEGCINAYYGVHTENPKTGVYVIVWETYEHHKALMQRADFPAIVAEFSPALTGRPKVANFMTDKNVGDNVYGAPVTEIAIWKLNEGRTEGEFRPEMEKLAQVLNNAKGAHPPCVWGLNEDGGFHNTVGWDVIEDQYEAVRPQEVQDLLKSIQEIAVFQITHAYLKKV